MMSNHRANVTKNRYNLKPLDIEKAVVLDRGRLEKKPFWRNDIIQAWVLSRTVGTAKDVKFGTDEGYEIIFYDKDAKSCAGKIKLTRWSFGGMCDYNFTKFYDEKQMDAEVDLEMHSELLRAYNWLIDNKIVSIRK